MPHLPNFIIKRFHHALFGSVPRLRMSANSFWACSSNFLLRSMAHLKPAMNSSLVFSLNLIITNSPFHIANITLCCEVCKRIKIKAPNDCSNGVIFLRQPLKIPQRDLQTIKQLMTIWTPFLVFILLYHIFKRCSTLRAEIFTFVIMTMSSISFYSFWNWFML